MKTLALTSLAASLALTAAARANDQATLRFLNEDSLPGNMRSLDRNQVTWDSNALERPASFFTREIDDVRIPAAPHIPDSAVGHEATLTLMNGDVVRGQLASVTDAEIVLDTWYAGQLVFRRVMVRELAVSEMPDYLYRGPGSIKDWTQADDESVWKMNDANALVSTAPGGIANDIPLPDEFTLDFEAQWQGSFRLHLILFSDDPTTTSPENGYEIVFQRQSVHIRRCGQRQWIGNSNRAIELQQNEKARIRFQASSRTGQFAFYVNDRIIDAWTDPDVDASTLGTALQFISRDNSPLVISRIDVSKWDGVLDEEPDRRPQVGRMGFRNNNFGLGDFEDEAEGDDDDAGDGGMLLKNGDRIRGTVKSIRDGMIHIETPFRDVSLPVERLRTIALEPVDLEEPKRENGDVRAWFADGGSIVFRLEGVTDDGKTIQGYSQTFGTAEFDLTAFNRIEFNLYDLFGDGR